MSGGPPSRNIYRVSLLRSAAAQFAALSRSVQLRIMPRIDSLAANPRPTGSILLSRTQGSSLYRIVVVNYRIIYEVRGRSVMIVSIKL